MSGTISNQTFLETLQNMYIRIHEGFENKLLKELKK